MSSTEESLIVNPKERRSFLCKMGAALSAVLAAGIPGAAQPRRDEHEDLKTRADRLFRQLGVIEDTKAIYQLHRTYGRYLHTGMHEEIVNLFAEDGEAYFNGGLFKGRDKGIRRLYVQRFGQRTTAKLDGPVHMALLDHSQEQPGVEVAPDGKSALARFHCLMQVSARTRLNIQ